MFSQGEGLKKILPRLWSAASSVCVSFPLSEGKAPDKRVTRWGVGSDTWSLLGPRRASSTKGEGPQMDASEKAAVPTIRSDHPFRPPPLPPPLMQTAVWAVWSPGRGPGGLASHRLRPGGGGGGRIQMGTGSSEALDHCRGRCHPANPLKRKLAEVSTGRCYCLPTLREVVLNGSLTISGGDNFG